MNISLDYDGTYTEDTEAWNTFIELFLSNGHNIFLVTMRFPTEANRDIKNLSEKISIIFTSRQAKKAFVESQGIEIDVWIDDNPAWIYSDSI